MRRASGAVAHYGVETPLERRRDAALDPFPTPEIRMRHIPGAILVAAVSACGDDTPATQPRHEQASQVEVRYEVVRLPTLGGIQSRGMAINQQGWVAGWSQRSDGTRRGVLWQGQSATLLGTLGGPSSTVPWPGLNDAGMIVGISHTGLVDPLNEDWACEFGGFLPNDTNLLCRGFFWENNLMRELPGLGGNHSFAAGVNNLGQIVGWAETLVEDETCSDEENQVLQFRAVLWEPKSGSSGRIKTTELHPLGDDATSAATAINDQGRAVGISGDCDQAVGRLSARHAVRWDKNGKATEIPNLGGTAWHTPMDINEQGDVVGFSNPDEDGDPEFIARAFLWTPGAAEATDLGTLDDDPLSEAFAINAQGQVVGISFGDLVRGPRAFLYENGELIDLNHLVDIGPDTLLSAQDINDAGQITGRVRDGVSREVVAFVATPVSGQP
jgi:probable HAF family extracellular repeat protein